MTITRDIRQTVLIKAKPRTVYEALMDSKKHAAFTGAPAKISRKVGGRFTAHGRHLAGINVELVKNERIVQAWRAANWPAGIFSIASFSLKRTRGGTVLTFTQTGIPAKNVRSINEGWRHHYWQPMKKALERQ